MINRQMDISDEIGSMIGEMMKPENWCSTVSAAENNYLLVNRLSDNQAQLHYHLEQALHKCTIDMVPSFLELVDALMSYGCLQTEPVNTELILACLISAEEKQECLDEKIRCVTVSTSRMYVSRPIGFSMARELCSPSQNITTTTRYLRPVKVSRHMAPLDAPSHDGNFSVTDVLKWDKKYTVIPKDKESLLRCVGYIENTNSSLLKNDKIEIWELLRQISELSSSELYDVQPEDYIHCLSWLVDKPSSDERVRYFLKLINQIKGGEMLWTVHQSVISYCLRKRLMSVLQVYASICEQGVEMLKANRHIFLKTLREYMDCSEDEPAYFASLVGTGLYPLEKSKREVGDVVKFLLGSGLSLTVELVDTIHMFKNNDELYQFNDVYMGHETQRIEWDDYQNYVNWLLKRESLCKEYCRSSFNQACTLQLIALPVYHNIVMMSVAQKIPQIDTQEYSHVIHVHKPHRLFSLMCFFYDVGYTVTPADLSSVHSVCSPDETSSELEDVVKSYISSPRTLQSLCRIAIRNSIPHQYVATIDNMGLCGKLRDYLLMSEYKNEQLKLQFVL